LILACILIAYFSYTTLLKGKSMSKKNKISPLVMGTLTLTMAMSLVNNANASIITGSTNGSKVIAGNIYLNAEDNSITSTRSGGTDTSGDASVRINLATGDVDTDENGEDGEDTTGLRASTRFGFGSYDEGGYIGEYKYENGLLSSSWNTTLYFSVNNCDAEGGQMIEDCLNKLDTDTTVGADWFNGTLGFANKRGTLFYEDKGSYTNGDEDKVFYENNLGNWGEIGDRGFVAFAFTMSDFDIFPVRELGPQPQPLSLASNEPVVDFWDRDDVQYGWLDITRGSISINSLVVQSSTVPVPAPSGLLLLGAGLFGLAARKKFKA
jgi:hypothetical protein